MFLVAPLARNLRSCRRNRGDAEAEGAVPASHEMAAVSLANVALLGQGGHAISESRGCASQPEDARKLLGVLGVFSHSANLAVRRTIRETWLTLAHESLVTRFVMRGRGDDRVA